MDDARSIATLIDSTTSKIQLLQKAFAELESHRAVTLNLKWKQLEEHFHVLEKSLKRRFTELEEQEKEFEAKTVESQKLLEEREAAVLAKEETTLERLQERRDAAVFAIANAIGKNRKARLEPAVVSCKVNDVVLVVEEKPLDVMASASSIDVKNCAENGSAQAIFYPQLVKLCKDMDSEGLHKFISDNRKNLATIKEEIPIALKGAPHPGNLVLDMLSGFYVPEAMNSDGKKDSNLLGLRRTCIMLMECLSVLLTTLDFDSVSGAISEEVKDRAKAIAEEWKPKLDDLDLDASNGNSLEAHAFLQLLATFGISSDFVLEDLSKLVPMVSRRRQAADLCRFLGLSEKMPGVIDVLVNSGRHIDAVNLVFAFELTEQFSPVSLLKSFLTEAKKIPLPVKSGNLPAAVQNDVTERELTALKAVIKCVDDHKLDEQYPLDPLQKRVLQIEKAKADKKRATEVSKPQSKRPRASGVAVGCGARSTNLAPEKTFYSRTGDRYPQAPYVYDRPYAYAESHVPAYMGPASYNVPVSPLGIYFNGYQYQAPYLH